MAGQNFEDRGNVAMKAGTKVTLNVDVQGIKAGSIGVVGNSGLTYVSIHFHYMEKGVRKTHKRVLPRGMLTIRKDGADE